MTFAHLSKFKLKSFQGQFTLTAGLWASLSGALVLWVAAEAGDKPGLFKQIKEKLRASPQCTVEFRSVVVSDFFDTADTTDGSISFASDGRYHTALGTDEFTFDGKCLWEYSSRYKQAGKNCIRPGQKVDESFLFFPRFDELYVSREIIQDSIYSLTIRKGKAGAGPDSMSVRLDREKREIATVEFLDVNAEKNVITVSSILYQSEITADLFIAHFPDSTLVIEVP